MAEDFVIRWEERMVTRYEYHAALEELPPELRAAVEAGRALTPADLRVLRGWCVDPGMDVASGSADLLELNVELLQAGRQTFSDDEGRPLPFVGDGLTIWFPGGSLSGVGGEVTQVTGSLVTLDHVATYDLALADDWTVRERPAGFGPGPYGWNPSAAHIARVEAELARQREQTARRRAEQAWRRPETGE